jgi:hypothetical protein
LSHRLLIVAGLVLGLLAPTPVLAQQAGGTSGWAPGPAASGDSGTFTGAVDSPTPNATLTGPNVGVAGWFVDRTAQGWAGADDVEVVLGSLESGRPLTHAQFAQNRPDVAAAMGNPFFGQSGWNASILPTALPAGPSTLSVYVHTPAHGWWFKQVSVTVRPPATSTPRPAAPPSPTPVPLGFDISYPQCATGAEPTRPLFGIVGVNAGVAFSGNPCLAREYVWALTSTSPSQPHVGFYLNTGNPGPTASTHWPAGATAPRACDGTASLDCAYDYGWNAAQDAYARAVSVAGSAAAASATWWLDVESANSWSTDPASNAADLEGSVAYLRSINVPSIGIYSTTTDWGTITGASGPEAGINAPFAALLNWRPGAHSLQEAPDWCSRTVTGGRVKLVQFPSSGFDANFVCF